jgi:hypothetical protein
MPLIKSDILKHIAKMKLELAEAPEPEMAFAEVV